MGSRLRSNARHIFECFCEVTTPEVLNQTSQINQMFPETFKDSDLLKKVSLFAFPCEMSCNTVQHFSFVLTSLDSKWTFGFCRQAPNAQTALVIISYLPWHELFFKILNQIAELMQGQALGDLRSFLDSLFERDVPEPGTTLHIPYGKAHQVYTCKCPNTYTLPSIPENRNLTEYFNAVDAQNMMIIFASMLHERRIVMVSSKISRLSACIQAANSIIYPMIWQHIFIPVLPPQLTDYLLAPMPYLAGVPSTTWERVRKSELGDMVVLDVDSNRIETPFSDLNCLPPDVVSVMRRRLKTPNNMMGDGVARVFLRALVQIIGGYRDALRFRQGEQITFCREAFLHSRQPALRPFLESMLHLQIFQQFIEERLEMLNSGQGFSDEFELEACLYSDKSSNRLKQQYKEWLSTMKKESGALFKSVKNKANPAVRQAVKTVKEQSKLAKEKSRIAYKDIRSKFKEMQLGREVDETDQMRKQLRDKPQSAPSSPKFSSLSIANKRHSGVSPKDLTRKLNWNIEKNHVLRRCETSVTHYTNGSNSGFPETISTSEDSSNDEELQMPQLNLDLVEDMKDYLFRPTSLSHSTPPAVDRSRKPSLSSPPHPSPTPYPSDATPFSIAPHLPLPLPPPRCRKRVTASSAIPCILKDESDVDLIRLDATSSIEEFDPLGQRQPSSASSFASQINPLYTLCIPKQAAVPQVPIALKGDHLVSEDDPFSNLLMLSRTNEGISHSVGSPGSTLSTDFSTSSRTWTTFD